MGEKLSTRREANSEIYEDSETYHAIRTLTDAGFLVKMSDIDLYHGRAGNGNEWRVEPDFNNSDNNTGHYNYNKIPALNTSHLGVAQDFANHRTATDGGIPEVHHIISDDPDARIIDADFNFFSLGQHTQNQVLSAIRATLPGISSGVPIEFKHRDALRNISPRDFISSNSTGLIGREDLSRNAKHLGLEQDLVQQISSAKNTYQLLSEYTNLTEKLINAYVRGKDDIALIIDDQKRSIPISREYLSSWFRIIHAIGYKTPVRSATLHGEAIDNYLLFDLEKVNTIAENQSRQKRIKRRLSKIALAAEKHHTTGNLAKNIERNLYLKPEEIITLAKQTPGYRQVFESDAGNWERFTLEEHTETVLRLFDDNYADILPASTLPIMRLALLVHDIGKPEAVRNFDKQRQKDYNLVYAQDFLMQNSVNEDDQRLILAMIGEGMQHTSRWILHRDQASGKELYQFCKNTMQKYLHTPFVGKETIIGFRNMLEVLQTCDSAAYTTMAVTRSKRSGVVYRNHGSFDNSFEQYRGLTNHRAQLKNSSPFS